MSMDDPLQRQEIPTHLEVEDRILFGLTLRQGIILLLGATAGYFLFAQSGQAIMDIHVPLALRIGLGLLPALVALAVAMIQPAGRPLEDWFFAIVRYHTVPKRCVWRPRPSAITPLSGRTADESVTEERVSKVASGNTSRVQFPLPGQHDQHERQDYKESKGTGSNAAKRQPRSPVEGLGRA